MATPTLGWVVNHLDFFRRRLAYPIIESSARILRHKAGLGWSGAGLGWGGAGLVLGWCWVGVELGGVGPGLGLVEDVGLGLGRGLGETS